MYHCGRLVVWRKGGLFRCIQQKNKNNSHQLLRYRRLKRDHTKPYTHTYLHVQTNLRLSGHIHFNVPGEQLVEIARGVFIGNMNAENAVAFSPG